MKAGVRTGPWAVCRVPVRADPSRAEISKRSRCGSVLIGRRVDGGAAADLHPRGLALCGLRHSHLEHPTVEGCCHPGGVDALGQAERAGEAAGGPLDAVKALLLLLVLGLALSADGEDAVLDFHLDVLFAQAREVGAKHEVLVRLHQVHRRDPAAVAAARGAVARPEEAVEEPVHVGLEAVQLANWVPSDDCHSYLLQTRFTLKLRSQTL